MAVRVSPIADSDVAAVSIFLHENLNDRVSAEAWARAVDVPWPADAPNHGFMLLADGVVVGVYLAFYAQRRIDGRIERFCNLGAWCVRPEFRMHSVRLLKALLGQPGYHFTDLSPSGNVVPMNSRLKFEFLDTTTALVVNLPWPSWPGRFAVSSDPAVIRQRLTGADLELYRDHADAPAARHLVITGDGAVCYVVFRKDRRKRLPLFVSILHVSDPALFRRAAGPLARHLLLRHGAPACLAELRTVRDRPRASVLLRSPRRKMYKSPHLRPDQIDDLYSELVCVAW